MRKRQTDGQTDELQTVTLRFPIDSANAIIVPKLTEIQYNCEQEMYERTYLHSALFRIS